METKETYYLVDYYLNEGKRVIEGVFTKSSWKKYLKKENEMRDKEDCLNDKDFIFTEIEVYN